MKKSIIQISFCILFIVEGAISQQTLTELLKEYRQASDYAQKTRIESLGHVIVFSREDIERMQAFTLADLLQYLKVGWVVPNRFGVESFAFQGTSTGISTFVRLYINDHEVSSVHTGSPFLTYDNYPLDHIDHVEIYYASGAIRLGDEPASVIIKLYTKKPERENAVTLRGSASNRMDSDVSFVDAREVKPNISYLIMLNKGYLNYETQFINNQPIYRNLWKNFVYFGLSYYKTFIELSFAKITRNIFQGLSLDAAPDEGKTKSMEYYLSLTHYFLNDRSLKVNLTFDGQHRDYYEKNSEGVFIPRVIDINDPTSIPIEYDEKVKLFKTTLNLIKEIKTDNNLLLTGFTIKDKHYHLDSRSYRTSSYYTEGIKFIEFDREILTSLTLEDQYNITDKNLIIISLRADKYFRKNEKDITDYMTKIGLISFLSSNYMIKTYIGRSYFPPTFLDYELSKGDLTQSKTYSTLVELIYRKLRNKISIFAGYERIKDPIIPDYQKGYLVNGKDYSYSLVALEYSYKENNGLDISLGYSRTFSTMEKALLSKETGYIRVTGKKERTSFYTELIYKKGFDVISIHIPDSYNLNAGISYLINENFSLKIKGINILNRGTKIPAISPVGDGNCYDSLDRKYFISFEVSY
ncbi:TonB-dependent receptor plug domain-containing protein [Persephonella sp.]